MGPAQGQNLQQEDQLIIGPYRVFPGRLSVCRTFGDIEAKRTKYGGNPKVIIADPEIKAFQINDCHDFLVLACKFQSINHLGDGVFDKLENKDVQQIAWDAAYRSTEYQGHIAHGDDSIHQTCGKCVEIILKASVASRTLDNITAVFIAFKNFKRVMHSGIVAEEPANSQGGSRLGHVLNMDLKESDVERIQSNEESQTRIVDPVPEALNIS